MFISFGLQQLNLKWTSSIALQPLSLFVEFQLVIKRIVGGGREQKNKMIDEEGPTQQLMLMVGPRSERVKDSF